MSLRWQLVLILSLAIVSAVAAPGRATILYTQPNPHPAMIGDGDDEVVIMDDIEINQAVQNPFQLPINVTRVTYGIVQFPGAAATSITGYYGATSTDNVTAGFPDPNVEPITSFGTADIPEFDGDTPTIYNAVIGNGTDTLFTLTPNFTNVSGQGQFALGLLFSSFDANSLWASVDPNAEVDANLDPAWFYVFAANEGFGYQLSDNQDTPFPTAFMVTIEGSLVPEPASLGILGMSALGLLRRRPSGLNPPV